MKKIIPSIFFLLLLFLGKVDAQQLNYTEYQLPSPYELSPLFVGSISDPAIFYGQEPPNSSNKPVLVFVHGFVDLANAWFLFGNQMYLQSYKKKYRTAFVAMTRGEGMWVNGELLSRMLDDITDHYGVNDVVIIAHSNGGKASEVAMFEHNKRNKVDRVISLGTPFFGTGLADLAEAPLLNYLVDFIDLGGGTATSTTYYMEDVARPYLDNHPHNQPGKFINLGAWGYKNGSTPMAPTMFLGGGVLNLMGGDPSTGGNDGVTPYYSSTRPGGHQIWDGWCWSWWCNLTSKRDHIDVAFSQYVWSSIAPWIEAPLQLRMANPDGGKEIAEGRGAVLESNYEIISTFDGTADFFTVGEDAGKVTVNLLYGNGDETFSASKGGVSHDLSENIVQGKKRGFASTTELENMEAGRYYIETDALEFGAFVSYEKGPILTYENQGVWTEGEAITLVTELRNADDDATLTGVITYNVTLDGVKVPGGPSYVVEFEKVKDKYRAVLPEGLSRGVYNLVIQAEGESYRRSIVGGFAVKPQEINQGASFERKFEAASLNVFPNPAEDFATVEFEIKEEGLSYINLYNAYGSKIASKSLEGFELGAGRVDFDMSQYSRGVYFVEFVNGNSRNTFTLNKQ